MHMDFASSFSNALTLAIAATGIWATVFFAFAADHDALRKGLVLQRLPIVLKDSLDPQAESVALFGKLDANAVDLVPRPDPTLDYISSKWLLLGINISSYLLLLPPALAGEDTASSSFACSTLTSLSFAVSVATIILTFAAVHKYHGYEAIKRLAKGA